MPCKGQEQINAFSPVFLLGVSFMEKKLMELFPYYGMKSIRKF